VLILFKAFNGSDKWGEHEGLKCFVLKVAHEALGINECYSR